MSYKSAKSTISKNLDERIEILNAATNFSFEITQMIKKLNEANDSMLLFKIEVKKVLSILLEITKDLGETKSDSLVTILSIEDKCQLETQKYLEFLQYTSQILEKFLKDIKEQMIVNRTTKQYLCDFRGKCQGLKSEAAGCRSEDKLNSHEYSDLKTWELNLQKNIAESKTEWNKSAVIAAKIKVKLNESFAKLHLLCENVLAELLDKLAQLKLEGNDFEVEELERKKKILVRRGHEEVKALENSFREKLVTLKKKPETIEALKTRYFSTPLEEFPTKEEQLLTDKYEKLRKAKKMMTSIDKTPVLSKKQRVEGRKETKEFINWARRAAEVNEKRRLSALFLQKCHEITGKALRRGKINKKAHLSWLNRAQVNIDTDGEKFAEASRETGGHLDAHSYLDLIKNLSGPDFLEVLKKMTDI